MSRPARAPASAWAVIARRIATTSDVLGVAACADSTTSVEARRGGRRPALTPALR
jgi:hypothetical protein